MKRGSVRLPPPSRSPLEDTSVYWRYVFFFRAIARVVAHPMRIDLRFLSSAIRVGDLNVESAWQDVAGRSKRPICCVGRYSLEMESSRSRIAGEMKRVSKKSGACLTTAFASV